MAPKYEILCQELHKELVGHPVRTEVLLSRLLMSYKHFGLSTSWVKNIIVRCMRVKVLDAPVNKSREVKG